MFFAKRIKQVPLGIKYSMRDLISDVNRCSSAVFVWYWSYNANDGSAPSCIVSFYWTM